MLRMLTAHNVYFLNQRIYVPITQFSRIPNFAIRAKVADTFAKRDMDVDACHVFRNGFSVPVAVFIATATAFSPLPGRGAGPGTRLFFAGLSCGRRNPGHRFCRKKPTFAGQYPCAGSGFACAGCGYGLSACRSPVGAVSHRRQVRPGIWLKAAARNGSSAELQR